jgi:hypothetical protein
VKNQEIFFKRSWGIYNASGLMKWVCFRFLAATSCYFAFLASYDYFKNGWIATIAALFAYLMIDYELSSRVEFLFDQGRENQSSAARIFLRIVLGITIVQMVATGTVSFWSSPEISDQTVMAPETGNLEKAILQKDSTYAMNVSVVQSTLDQLRSNEKERVKNAQSKGSSIVRKAIYNHRNPDVPAGYLSGKEWYHTTPKLRKYRNGIEQAKQDSALIVQKEMDKVSQWEQQLIAVSGDTETGRTTTLLASSIHQKNTDYQAKKSRRTSFLILCDLFSILIGTACIYGRVQFRKATEYDPNLDKKSISYTLSLWFQQVWNKAVERLEKWLNVDLDQNGTIGSIGTPTPTPVSHSAPSGTPDVILDATVKNLLEKSYETPKTKELTPVTQDNVERIVKQVAGVKSDQVSGLTLNFYRTYRSADFSKIIQHCRNAYRSAHKKISRKHLNDARIEQTIKSKEENRIKYEILKGILQDNGYEVIEKSRTSLTIRYAH